jgi:single-strand DNA-binding protein
MFNKVILVGNLTRDIELRYSQAGMGIAKTAIATSRKFTSNGEKKEEVCFVDITFFGRSAEVANQYLRKGSKILVEGRLNFEQWVDQNGGKRSKHSVTVETMQMLDSKGDNAGGMGGGQPYDSMGQNSGGMENKLNNNLLMEHHNNKHQCNNNHKVTSNHSSNKAMGNNKVITITKLKQRAVQCQVRRVFLRLTSMKMRFRFRNR